MARKEKTATQEPARGKSLISQYNAIGPAALIAALLCVPRSRKRAQGAKAV